MLSRWAEMSTFFYAHTTSVQEDRAGGLQKLFPHINIAEKLFGEDINEQLLYIFPFTLL